MNTLVVDIGSLQHAIRFFELAPIVANPSRLLFGTEPAAHPVGFTVLCIVCLTAPVLPHLTRSPLAWLGYAAPLALMCVCGAILHAKTSGEFFASPSDAKSLNGSIIRFANDLVHHGSGLVARHISVGAGAYLGLLGSAVLALSGLRRYCAR